MRAGGALAATLLAAGLAACGSSDSGGTSVEVTTGNAAQGTSAETAPSTESAPPADSGGGDAGPARLQSLTVNGEDQSTDFPDTRCEWETDNGHPQLEFQAQNDAADTELEVEIVMSDPPRLDDFEFETPQNEWEASDADAAQATITSDGGTYRVDSPVTDDNDQSASMTAAFTCPKH